MLAVDLSGSERFGTRAAVQERAGDASWRGARDVGGPQQRPRRRRCCSPIASSTSCRRGRGAGTRCASSATCSRSSRRAAAPTSPAPLSTSPRCCSHKAIIFLVSDFIAPDIERPLKLLAQRHDVVAVTVEDPSERALPDIGLARFVDPETGATVDVDTSDPSVRKAFERDGERRGRASAGVCLRRLAIDEIAGAHRRQLHRAAAQVLPLARDAQRRRR